MTITTNLTEKDKKLLSGMSAVLILAVFGFLIIRPLHQASTNMKSQITDNEAKVEEVRGKVAALDAMRVTNENTKARLEIAQQEVYPMLRSKDIDRILSGLVEENHLSTTRLQIQMPEESANVIPFLAVEDTEGSNPDGLDGLYAANVTLEVTGEQNGLDQLVDEISKNQSGIRIERLIWNEVRGTTDPVTGVTPMERSLVLELTIYMSSAKEK